MKYAEEHMKMKFIATIKPYLTALLLVWQFKGNVTFTQEKYPFHDIELLLEERDEDLIGRLTLDEKARLGCGTRFSSKSIRASSEDIRLEQTFKVE